MQPFFHHRFRYAGLLALMLGCCISGRQPVAADTSAPRKIALLVGVTEMKNTPDAALRGPTNDVAAMRRLLEDRYGFAPGDVRTVEKREASKAGIVAAIEQLIRRARAGDLVVLYYSGHGDQVPDQAPRDEADGLDEALIPYDANVDASGEPIPATLLLDDEINALLARIPTRNVVVLIDACHSGTVTRGGAQVKRWVQTRAVASAGEPLAASDHLGSDLVGPTVLTAASATQTAKDWPFLEQEKNKQGAAGNANMGAFTWYLLDALQRDSDHRLTYRQIITRISAGLVAGEFSQTPQIEGSRLDTPFLALEPPAAPPPPSPPDDNSPMPLPARLRGIVSAVNGARSVQVRADGGGHFTPGSIFEGAGLSVRITGGGLEAPGEVLKGEATPTAQGRALALTWCPLAPPRLRVAVTGKATPATSRATVSAMVHALSFVTLVPATGPRDIDLDLSADGQTVTPYRNQLALRPVAANDSASLRAVLENLSALASLTGLDNPNSSFSLDIQVNGKDTDVVAVGGTVAFTARVSQPCYLYLLDVDPAGKVTVLFPNRYASSNRLDPGKEYNMPMPQVYRLRVQGPAGPEVIKAIATERPLTLEALAQDRGELAALPGDAFTLSRQLVDQLRQGINQGKTLPTDSNAAETLISTAGWAADTVYIRVTP